jgi:DNA-binding SARP family transcriptional activator
MSEFAPPRAHQSFPKWPEHHSNWGCAVVAIGSTMHSKTKQGVQKGFAMSSRERLKVHVLGRFRLTKGDIPIAIPPRLRKPRELLQSLIAFGGTEVGAGVLIDALWPDSEGDAAYHALESALYRLRQLLGARDAVLMEGGKVSLNRDQLWVDMWEFEEELQRPRDPLANGLERIGRLRLLYQGHFLQLETE